MPDLAATNMVGESWRSFETFKGSFPLRLHDNVKAISEGSESQHVWLEMSNVCMGGRDGDGNMEA